MESEKKQELVIDGNSFYEIDLKCLKEKKQKQTEGHSHEEEGDDKKELACIISGAVLFAIGIILNHTIDNALASFIIFAVAFCGAFFRFQCLPGKGTKFSVLRRKNLRMTELHLISNSGNYILDCKNSFFLSDQAVKHNLKQYISQFLTEIVAVSGFIQPVDPIQHFL